MLALGACVAGAQVVAAVFAAVAIGQAAAVAAGVAAVGHGAGSESKGTLSSEPCGWSCQYGCRWLDEDAMALTFHCCCCSP